MTDETRVLAAEIKLHIEEKCGEIREDVAAIDARQELMREDIARLKRPGRNAGAVAGAFAGGLLGVLGRFINVDGGG